MSNYKSPKNSKDLPIRNSYDKSLSMTDLEYDLYQNVEMIWNGWETEINYKSSANNLYEMGYQKIVWHDAKKELPERLKYVLGYDVCDQAFAVVKWDYADWSDDNEICYNVDYWAELPEPPEINIED